MFRANQDFALISSRISIEKSLTECLKRRVKHGTSEKIVSGVFPFIVVGELIWCNKHIDNEEYINILEKGLLQTLNKLYTSVNHVDIIFQLENAL